MRRDILYRINELTDALSNEAVTLFADRAEDIVNRQLNRELDREIAQDYLSDEHNATTELLDALRAYTQRINRYARVYQYEEDEVEKPLQNPYATKAQNPYR